MTISDRNTFMVTPADNVSGPKQGQWTYKDYVTIPADGKRYEVVDGVLFMTPSPDKWHQKAAGRIFRYLSAHIEDTGKGEVYIAPFDVELDPKTVVQPDVIVLLKPNLAKATNKRIIGAPDLVVEVASPATANYDRREKLDAYASAGVTEYWIVDPTVRTIKLLILDAAHYRLAGIFEGKNTLPSKVIPDFPVPVEKFFAYLQI